MKRFILLCMIGLVPCLSVRAQQPVSLETDVAALKVEVKELRRMIEEQRRAHDAEMAELRRLIAGTSGAKTSAGPAVGDDLASAIQEAQVEGTAGDTGKTAGTAPSSRFAGAPVQSSNPDISLVGNFMAGHDNKSSGLLRDKNIAGEMELGISGNIDSYLRYNGVFSISPNAVPDTGYGISVEEAYVSPLGTPYGLDWKLGRFRADFGKVNEMHMHALPWPEYPLAIQKFFGEEGLAGDGASVSWLAPGNKYIELTAQSFRKDSEHLFGGDDAADSVHLLHLKTVHDLTDESTLELGMSGAVMPQSQSGGNVTVEGLDLTYKWRPHEKGLYRSFKWMNEALFSQRMVDGRNVNAFGMYTAPEYQFARRWAVGARYDFTQEPDDITTHTQAVGAYLTFLQSEYCFWRLGYQVSKSNDKDDSGLNNMLMLQLNISLGPHPAHKY